MDSSQYCTAAKKAIDQIANYYDTLEERPVLPSVKPGYLRPLLPDGPPQNGEAWDKIQADIDRFIMPGLTHWQSPKFMAFFPCNSSFPAMIGDMYSGAFNAAAFNWICSPAITELETIVMDWVCNMIGLPKCFLSTSETGGGGIIQGTASEVIVTAVVAARERLIRRRLANMPEGEERLDKAAEKRGRLVALGSEQAHSSTMKAAIIAGTRFRSVPATKESNYGVTVDALRKTIEECYAKGLEPFYFTATLGSTGTCAVDDLAGIAELAKEYPDIWIHVDAAYAGSALVCPEYQHLCPPIANFDSFNLNLHKWLLVNFDCSAFYVKRRKDLIDTYSIAPSYLRNEFTESGLVTDYRDWQIPLGRRFRSLKVWFVLRTYGVSGLQEFIRKHIKLGEYFHELLKSRSDIFGITTEPAFGLVTFQVKPSAPIARKAAVNQPDPAHEACSNDMAPDAEAQYREDVNHRTKEVYEAVNSKGEFFLTSAVVCGAYVIRVVSATILSEEKYLKGVFDALVKAAEGSNREGSKIPDRSSADPNLIPPHTKNIAPHPPHFISDFPGDTPCDDTDVLVEYGNLKCLHRDFYDDRQNNEKLARLKGDKILMRYRKIDWRSRKGWQMRLQLLWAKKDDEVRKPKGMKRAVEEIEKDASGDPSTPTQAGPVETKKPKIRRPSAEP